MVLILMLFFSFLLFFYFAILFFPIYTFSQASVFISLQTHFHTRELIFL